MWEQLKRRSSYQALPTIEPKKDLYRELHHPVFQSIRIFQVKIKPNSMGTHGPSTSSMETHDTQLNFPQISDRKRQAQLHPNANDSLGEQTDHTASDATVLEVHLHRSDRPGVSRSASEFPLPFNLHPFVAASSFSSHLKPIAVCSSFHLSPNVSFVSVHSPSFTFATFFDLCYLPPTCFLEFQINIRSYEFFFPLSSNRPL